MERIKINPEALSIAEKRLNAFNKANGILRGDAERIRSRYLGVAVELDFVKRITGEYPDTYADVTVPDDNGVDIVLDGVPFDVKVTRPPNATSWVWAQSQVELRKKTRGTDYGYLFLSANPIYTAGSLLPYTCEYVVCGQLTATEVLERSTKLRQKRDEKNVTIRVVHANLNTIEIALH